MLKANSLPKYETCLSELARRAAHLPDLPDRMQALLTQKVDDCELFGRLISSDSKADDESLKALSDTAFLRVLQKVASDEGRIDELHNISLIVLGQSRRDAAEAVSNRYDHKIKELLQE